MFPGLVALILSALPAQAASQQKAAGMLGVARMTRIKFSGSGHWYQFGQAPSAVLCWPQFDVSQYVADIVLAGEL